MKLAIVTTHPIQYYAPWFKYMSDHIDLHVYYMHQESAKERSKGDFGVVHEWDVDLLSGYNYTFLNNIAKEPCVNSFSGCDTPEIYKIIKEGNFDAVLVLGWYLKAFWQTIFACKINKVPVLVRGDSRLQDDQSFLKKTIKRLAYPMMLKMFDGFLYVGENNKQYLKYYNVDENKMFFCPHFIDQDFFYTKSQEYNKATIRENMNIQKESTVLLFVGKFIEKKRPLDILYAMKLLENENIKTHAVFVGSGKLEDELRTYCRENRELNVDFVGFKNQSELPMYYKLADILILPSSSETWGLVVNEAFACLIPSIVSDEVGCMPDLIERGFSGEIFKCCDTIDLAAKIKRFILDAEFEKTKALIQEKNEIYSMQYATKELIKAMKYLKSDAK